jgi:hypothetical protein
MKTKRLIITGLIAAGALTAGCAPQSSTLDDNWGRSVETARYNQILNSKAELNLEPVEGLDGPSALNTLGAYRKGFSAEESSTGYDIKLTGIGSKK